MRFWDSSALVPTVLLEPTSDAMRSLFRADTSIAVWWGTVVECSSAIARRERAGDLDPDESIDAQSALSALESTWSETPPSFGLRRTATRLVRTHDLRAADAFQLAAARIASDGQPESLPFVTLDDRLALAARREGFPVLPG